MISRGTAGVYCIRHNVPDGSIYVGSSVNIRVRLERHKYDLRGGRHHSPKLQASWAKYGEGAFIFSVLQIVEDHTDLLKWEQHWIDALGAWGPRGLNSKPLAKSWLGVKHSEEAKEKIRKAHLGKKFTPEHLANMAVCRLGKRHSESSCAKMSAARAGLKQAPEAVAKRTAAIRGQKRSEETKARMSAWQKGKPLTTRQAANLAKLHAAAVGRKHSEEWAANISAAWTPERRAAQAALAKRVLANGPNQEARERAAAKRRGRKASPETLAKLSAAKNGKPMTPKHAAALAKIHAAAVGRKHSAERKAKMSAAWSPERRAAASERISKINRLRKLQRKEKAA